MIQTIFIQLLLANISESQQLKDFKISIDVQNTSLEVVLSALENQTQFTFGYDKRILKTNGVFTIHESNVSLEDVLLKIAQEGRLRFKRINDQILVLKDKKRADQPVIIELAEREISGKVRDGESGEPLPGATVLVQGLDIGTTTDLGGNFRLSIPEDAEFIIISYVGYISQEIEIKGKSHFEVDLNVDALGLQEIIVTGYTIQDKKDLTGAVTPVEMEKIVNFPVAGVENMLQGQVPGVTVVSDNAPGGNSAVRIRGFSTIRNNDPLYIIDGVPTTAGLNLINPADIESLQVLKDASSASIYGSRAANGVVIITTKKGRSGKTQITFDAYGGVQQAQNLPKMLDAQQYGDLLWEANKNDGKIPSSDIYGDGPTAVIPQWLDSEQTVPSDNVDWVDEIFRMAPIQNYNLALSTGNEISRHLLSLGYFDQTGVIKHTRFKRVSARFNTDYNFRERLNIGMNLSASYAWNNRVNNNSALGGTIYNAYRFPSITPVYDVNGEFAGSPLNDIQNPMGYLERNKDNTQKELKIFTNVFADLEIVKGLSFRTNFGIDYSSFNKRHYNPRYREINTQRLESDLNTSNSFRYNWVWSNTLNYLGRFGKHNIDVLAGTESVEFYSEQFSASRVGFPYDEPNFRYLNAGEGNDQKNSGTALQWTLFSYFAKVNYDFDRRYLFSATIRRDGTSKLSNNKWGTFPAFSAGWRISEEEFFGANTISNFKVRFGWGQNGNQDIPPYSTFDSYRSNPYYSNYALDGAQNKVLTGYTQTRNSNPDLKWETSTQTNIGIDFGLLEDRIEITADYFVKNTENLLLERPLPPNIGGTNQTVWDNAGSMENKGIELNFVYRSALSQGFVYDIGLNFASIKNKLTALPEDIEFISIPSSTLHTVNFDQEVSRTTVGQPIASFFGYDAIGIYQTASEIGNEQPGARPGDIKFRDVVNDGVINADDRTFIGSPHPDFTTALTFNASLNNLDLSLFFYGSFGAEIYDLTRYYLDFYNLSAYNKHERTLRAWRPDNTDTDVPRLSLDDPNNNIRPSSYYVKNGDYLRLKNFQIGYTIPDNVLENSRIRFYLQVQNLFTITGYDGLDPEVGLQNYSSNDRNLDIGVDRGVYPSTRTFTIGANLSF
ncbi:MAG: TonB-dependent receptor [Cytophagales bacterium]|nr:TonB-dependent receptor [Cytophagales bacterium]